TNASSKKGQAPAIFPWLNPTRTSEKGSRTSITTPVDVHPMQVFWAMPRRIRLVDVSKEGICDICGRYVARLVNRHSTRNYGVNYKGGWLHPLTPYTEIERESPNPQKGQPGGVHYRHWLGLVLADDETGKRPARVVKEFWERQSKWPELHKVFRSGPRLWTFAYDMDNMKARCWYESTMPLLEITEEIRPKHEDIVARVVRTATFIASNVRRCVKQALFRRPADVSGDLSIIDARFWQGTESTFYSVLNACRDNIRNENALISLKLEWLKTLATAGERIFNEVSQNDQIEVADPKRIALAARDLRRQKAPMNRKIREILDLPKNN